jgi:hypothetical protein
MKRAESVFPAVLLLKCGSVNMGINLILGGQFRRRPKRPSRNPCHQTRHRWQPTTSAEDGQSPEIRKQAELASLVNTNHIGVSHLPSTTGNATSSVGVTYVVDVA